MNKGATDVGAGANRLQGFLESSDAHTDAIETDRDCAGGAGACGAAAEHAAGPWGNPTDEVDRYEFTTPSVFKDVNEWKNRLSRKTGTNKDDATYSYDVNGNLTDEVVDIVRVTTNTERRDFAYDGRHARRTPRLLVRLEPVGLGTRGKSAARSRHVGAR